MELLTIGKVANQTGVTVEAVRFYEKQGLIAEPQRTESGYRQYPPDTIKRVHFIQHAKEAGFTLKDIGELLKLRREPGTTCADIKLRTLEKINEVDQKIKDLQKIKESLEQMVLRCSDTGELDECPILETLEFDERI